VAADLLVLNDDTIICPECYEPPIIERPDDLVIDVVAGGLCKWCGGGNG
jgi:hypothetical protein